MWKFAFLALLYITTQQWARHTVRYVIRNNRKDCQFHVTWRETANCWLGRVVWAFHGPNHGYI